MLARRSRSSVCSGGNGPSQRIGSPFAAPIAAATFWPSPSSGPTRVNTQSGCLPDSSRAAVTNETGRLRGARRAR